MLQFPGSNCDQDALWALRRDIGVGADYVWHKETSLSGFDAVFVPGGFSYGDYLRCGAVAAHAPIMRAVVELARAGGLVIGACNGFQILCEVGLLPGALLKNSQEKFVCKSVTLRSESSRSPFTLGVDRLLQLPIAHGEGRFVCDEATLREIESKGQVAFRYVDKSGQPTLASNPNGSQNNIAGVMNESGNVLGLMPHPERATNTLLGSTDGRLILQAFSEGSVISRAG